MGKAKINKIFAVFIAFIALYTLFVVANNIVDIHQSSKAFFNQTGSIYPSIIAFVTALVPVSVAVISYFVYTNKRTYFILLPTIHAILLFSSYIIYGMISLLLIWWLANTEVKAT